MPNYSAQVSIWPVSNLSADVWQNTFSFSAVDDTDLPSIATALVACYNLWRPEMSLLSRQNGHVIKFYDRSDPEPRAPRYEESFNLSSAPTGAAMPPEVALCLSFQANPQSGIPQSRRRGRIYLGSISSASLASTGRPDGGCVAAAIAFGQSLLDASDAAPDWEWVVWSTVNNAPYIVTNGWVDDEFDTQRSRGKDPTGRSLFS